MNRVWIWCVHPPGIHPWRWRLLTAWVIGFSLIVAYAVEQGWQAHKDLCRTRANAEAQVEVSQQFLDDIESGRRPPIVGITPGDLRLSIKRQTLYVKSIHC